jgi:hypothetical protein
METRGLMITKKGTLAKRVVLVSCVLLVAGTCRAVGLDVRLKDLEL